MKAGVAHSNAVSTVSETYAREITTPEYGFSMDGVIRGRSADLYGIVNGIDYDKNNPETDPHIFKTYSIDTARAGKADNKAQLQQALGLQQKPEAPLFGIISRLADQKGFDILSVILEELLSRDVQLAVLGQGDSRYEQMFSHFQWKYPHNCRFHMGFNESLAQKIYAASDFFLMPSFFEPCGLGQITAMRYGTLPIVRKTGGLADTVQHFDKAIMTGNGFSFDDYLASGLAWAVNEALEIYQDKAAMSAAVKNAMSGDYSWRNSAAKYVELYKVMTL